MKIYKVERTDKWSYDDYDSFVCFANSEDEARHLHPVPDIYEWRDHPNLKEHGWYFKYFDGKYDFCKHKGSWTNPENLKVFELNRDPKDGKPTVILASFNAG